MSWMSRNSSRPRRREARRERCRNDLTPLAPEERPQSAGSLRKHVVAASIEHRKSNVRENAAAFRKSMEVTPFNPLRSPESSLDFKDRTVDAGYSLKTSTELLKVLNRIWSLEEQVASSESLVKELKVELEHANARIQELLQEQKTHHCEMEDLVNQIADGKLVRKGKEHGRTMAAVQSIREELDDERRLRRRSESLHRKLGKELYETKTTLSKAVKDLESEIKSRYLLEDLCDEFAKGIWQYEKEIRELKKKYKDDPSCKVDGLVHISEAWLDERLQMQMVDQSVNDNVVLRLKDEILSFLQSKQSENIKDCDKLQNERKARWQSLESLHLNGTISAPREMEDDDSTLSDLHCFELNVGKPNEGSHDMLNSHVDSNLSKFQYAEKLSSTRKSMGYNRSIKAESSSLLKEGFDGQTKGKDLYNPTVKTDADSEVVEDDSEVAIDHGVKKHLASTSGCKVHCAKNREEASHVKASHRGSFLPIVGDDMSGNFLGASSPVRHWNFGELDMSKGYSKGQWGAKDGSLKARLLEARLEGRHARLKALKGASIKAADE
ncbi:hypothetical protein HPP92_002837 [Vanilla planifolia]|uniref:Uncharacterized protein n=1 Tax=Vanilla planifolia TaxID=51239 RepID=A0A835VIV3_VANPL|nr:hypothetical protein HPP92_002837 [Vanilla planifolia]